MTDQALSDLIGRILEEKQRYLMVSQGRCGSTMLYTALDTHPDMRWYGELFAPEAQPGYAKNWTLGYRLQKAWGEPRVGFSLVDHAISWRLPTKLGMTNLPLRKVKKTDVKEWAANDAIARQFIYPILRTVAGALKVILLHRKNLLARYVSQEFSKQAGIWHIRKRRHISQMVDAPPVHIDPAAAKADIAAMVNLYEELRRDFPNSIHCTYEGLQSNINGELSRIFDFLNVRKADVQPATHKIPRPWQDRVSNMRELKEHFPQFTDGQF